MLFNSIEFLLLLSTVFILYWYFLEKSYRSQNILILISSYIFYGWWDWRFLSLIFFSSTADYILGGFLNKGKLDRKLILICSIVINISLLFVFKYYNFFIESFTILSEKLNFTVNDYSISIILPVGISFYTFQTLSYTIDIFNRKIKPTDDYISFLAYVSFFPQLVAGPIERASNLLPQFQQQRKFSTENIKLGVKQIIWGFFKKIVIADNCAIIVNSVYQNPEFYGYQSLILASVLFAIQIYCDFSGYSDIAIGTAKLFGFKLMQNFNYPYFSRDIAEFWRRWHISLSTWFRDYIYIPLGGSRVNKYISLRNIFIIFLVSGFWHGANWTFIIWGLLHALLFVPSFIMKNNRKNMDTISLKNLSDISVLFNVLKTFIFVTFLWIIFRAENIEQAFFILKSIFTLHTAPGSVEMEILTKIIIVFSISVMFIFEFINRNKDFGLYSIKSFGLSRYLFYILILFLISDNFLSKQDFIYFQF